MRSFFTIAALLLNFESFAVAQAPNTLQLLDDLSPCALNCLTKTPSNCSLTDTKCTCADTGSQLIVQQCLASSCTVKEGLSARNVSATYCQEPSRDRSTELKTSNIAIAIVSAFFVLLRLGHKIFGPSEIRFGLDDVFIFITLLSLVPTAVIVDLELISNGLGRDIWTVPFDSIAPYGMYFFWIENLYFASMSLLKLSFLFFFKRIFPARTVQTVIWVTMILNVLWGIASVIAGIFQCTPISFSWTSWDGEHTGTCVSIKGLIWSHAVLNIVFDLWLLAIPLSQLIHLQLSWSKKWGVALMFCLGTLSTVISVVRLQFLVNVSYTVNPTWDQSDIIKWSDIELGVGIICACLPSIRLVLARSMPTLFGSTHDRSQRSRPADSDNKLSRNTFIGLESLSGQGDESKRIHCTTTFKLNQQSTDDDELELVQIG